MSLRPDDSPKGEERERRKRGEGPSVWYGKESEISGAALGKRTDRPSRWENIHRGEARAERPGDSSDSQTEGLGKYGGESIDGNLDWRGGGWSCIACEARLSVQTPMCPLSTRKQGKKRGRWCNRWGVHGDQVTSQPLYPGPARLAAWPVPPQERMGSR
jgi:hypothetical protein